MNKQLSYYDSPIGRLTIIIEARDGADALTMLGFVCDGQPKDAVVCGQDNHPPLIAKTIKQLDEYFAGTRTDFDLPLSLQGTDFQKSVWQALRQVPFGKTESYGQLAKRIGKPKAARAVGSANNKNPIALIIPCHRIIGAKGALVGYRGGLEAKTALLQLEGFK